MSQSWVQEFMLVLTQVPLRGRVLAIVAAVSSAGLYLLIGSYPLELLWIPAVLHIIVGLAILYTVCMWMTGQRHSVVGSVRFILVSALLLGPMIAANPLVFSALATGNVLLASGALLLTYAMLILAGLLAAWPVLQANDPRLVSPVRVLKATKGYRLPIAFVAYLIGAGSRVAWDPPSNAGVKEILLACVVSGAVAAVILLVAACVAVTSWKFVRRADPGLGDP